MMRFTIIQLWERYKYRLKAWDGSLDGLVDLEEVLMGYMGVQRTTAPATVENADYQPPKFTGDIMTAEPVEDEMPLVVTTADVTTPQGCYHLYNMLLAKKGSDMRIGEESGRADISKARKQIIMMYHPDRWQSEEEKANFFMKKVNVAWEVLSKT